MRQKQKRKGRLPENATFEWIADKMPNFNPSFSGPLQIHRLIGGVMVVDMNYNRLLVVRPGFRPSIKTQQMLFNLCRARYGTMLDSDCQ